MLQIPLQTEKLESTGQLVLTCFLLPQIQLPSQVVSSTPQIQSSKRHICFNEQVLSLDQPTRLTRAPTPYPKDLQRYQRYLNNQFRKTRELPTPQNMNINSDQFVSEIREAKVTPMKNDEDEYNLQEKPEQLKSCNPENVSQVYDNSDRFSSNSKLSSYNPGVESQYEAVDKLYGHTEGLIEFSERKKCPPPYHIAAAYSKNAHFFNKMDNFNNVQIEKPKNFTQELPKNISMPKPLHYSKEANNVEEKYFLEELRKCLIKQPGNMKQNDHVDGIIRTEKSGPKQTLIHINLTPCCYVLGFAVTYNENVSTNK